MSKIKDPESFLLDQGIRYEEGSTKVGGLNIRLTGSGGLDVGEADFDRWSVSIDFSFDLLQKKGQRAFKRWLRSL